MGTPLEPNEPGIACPRCSTPGRPFNSIATPKYMIVKLWALEEGEHWDEVRATAFLTTFYVPQTQFGCWWHLTTDNWFISLAYSDVADLLTVQDRITFAWVFSSIIAPACSLYFPNEIIAPAGVFAFNGYAEITFNPFT